MTIRIRIQEQGNWPKACFPVSMLSSEASFSFRGGQKEQLFFYTWWLTLHFFDIEWVLNTRQHSDPDRGARKLTKGRASLSPHCPRRPADFRGGQKEQLFFYTWWLKLHFIYTVRVLNTRQFGSGSRSKEIGNWPKSAHPASMLSSEASFSWRGGQKGKLFFNT